MSQQSQDMDLEICLLKDKMFSTLRGYSEGCLEEIGLESGP